MDALATGLDGPRSRFVVEGGAGIEQALSQLVVLPSGKRHIESTATHEDVATDRDISCCQLTEPARLVRRQSLEV